VTDTVEGKLAKRLAIVYGKQGLDRRRLMFTFYFSRPCHKAPIKA